MDMVGTSILFCLEVVPSSEVEMYRQLIAWDKQFVLCREIVLFKGVLYQRFQCITCLGTSLPAKDAYY